MARPRSSAASTSRRPASSTRATRFSICSWWMKWHLGLRGTDIFFDSTADETKAAAGAAGASGIYERRVNNNFWGLGPSWTLDLERRIGDSGFTLVGRLDGASSSAKTGKASSRPPRPEPPLRQSGPIRSLRRLPTGRWALPGDRPVARPSAASSDIRARVGGNLRTSSAAQAAQALESTPKACCSAWITTTEAPHCRLESAFAWLAASRRCSNRLRSNHSPVRVSRSSPGVRSQSRPGVSDGWVNYLGKQSVPTHRPTSLEFPTNRGHSEKRVISSLRRPGDEQEVSDVHGRV